MASLVVPHPQKQAAYNSSKAAVVKLTQSYVWLLFSKRMCNAGCAAASSLPRRLATEWIGRGVRVNAISPGIVDTALIRVCTVDGPSPHSPPTLQDSPDLAPLVEQWMAQIPAARLATVADLQAAVVFLASDASGYCVGLNLTIEGGQTLW